MGGDELEALVVRIVGDASGFTTACQQSAARAQQTATEVGQYATRVESFGSRLQGFAGAVVAALGVIGASGLLRNALGEFQSSELAALKLNAAMESQGRNVVALNKQYDVFAEQMQRVTTVEDDAVRAMLAQAENMGLTGEKAMRAVKNAIALASKAGDASNAGGFIRITAALEEGRVMARVINPALMNIKDNAERAAKAQDMLAKMFGTAEAAAKSSSGGLKQLGVAYGNLLEDFGQVVAEYLTPVVNFAKQVVQVVAAISPETKKLIVQIIGVAAAVLAGVAAWQTYRILLVVVQGLFTLLHVEQLISLGTWLAWKAAVLIGTGVLFLFNAQMTAWDLLLSGGTLALAAWSIESVVSTAVTWLFNAALAAMNVLLAPATILAAAGTVAILAVGLVVVGSAVWGVYRAAVEVWNTLSKLPTTSGPLADVSAVFREWYAIIQDVVRAAQTDLPLAWKIVQAGATLAVSQIRDLWPPLWLFIQDGFVAIWGQTARVFRTEMYRALRLIQNDLDKSVNVFGSTPRLDAERKKINAEADATNKISAQKAEQEMKAALKRYSGMYGESPATKAARAELQKLRDEIGKAVTDTGKGPGHVAAKMDKDLKAASHELEKIEGQLRGGAEAFARIAAYRDRFEHPEDYASGKGEVKAITGKGGAADMKSKAEDYLARIARATEKAAKNPGADVDLDPADFDG